MEQDFKNADTDEDGKLSQNEVLRYLNQATLPQTAKQQLLSLYDSRIPESIGESKNNPPVSSAKPIQELVNVIIDEAIKKGRIDELRVEPHW